MAKARDDILTRLRSQMRGEYVLPSVWKSRRRFDDLAERFTESLINAGGETIHAGSLDAALERLSEQWQVLHARRIVVNDEPPFSDLDLSARWPDVEWHIVGRTGGELRAFCVAADVGLSGADAALAETGSIVVSSGPGRSRLATLLPPVHIAFVPTARLVADIFAWVAARQGRLPANQTLISGPSKTADIEQTLEIGVHGPKRFVVILYGDELHF